jgi:hypothetical protein
MRNPLINIGLIVFFSALSSIIVLRIATSNKPALDTSTKTEQAQGSSNTDSNVLSSEIVSSSTISPTPTTILRKSKTTTPTSQPVVNSVSKTDYNDGQLKQQLIESINRYNEQVRQQQNQQAQKCNEGTQNANQEYDPQIQSIQTQIDDLEKQKSEVCPYGEFAEACMVGSIRKQLDYLNGQIGILQKQINSLQTNKNNVISLACGGDVSFPETSVYSYVQSSVPTYFRIESQTGGSYVIYDNSGSLYWRVQPDGSGGYVVY